MGKEAAKKPKAISPKLWPYLNKSRVAKLLGMKRQNIYKRYKSNRFSPNEMKALKMHDLLNEFYCSGNHIVSYKSGK